MPCKPGQINGFLKLNINKCKTLERVDVIKDLGVMFDSDLTFVSHCKLKRS